MFIIDFILIAVGIILLSLGFFSFCFSNKFFDYLSYFDLPPVFIMGGIMFVLFPLFFSLIFNRCDSCQEYVSSDYCTVCGSFVVADSICSCGANLDDRYIFCPSCGRELDLSNDFE